MSAFKGTWEENKRPYVTLAPDAYVSIQGQTSVITCGECNRQVDLNKYITGISTETSVDSPPGSATINLSIPDTDVNEFFVEGNFVVIPMMEIEIFAKGYFTVGGVPQYYKIFWGMIVNISKNWSNGVTTFTLSCKDILHWWEKTNVITNPAFVGKEGASCGYQLFGNQFAGLNPYTIMISLARESMGDFSITDGSFMSHKPEAGPEERVVGQYAKDIMAYWQLKFGNIWNSLVLYGTSGMAYTFEGSGDISPAKLSFAIFKNEVDILAENPMTASFKFQPHEIAAVKLSLDRAGDVQFFQNDTQSKLAVALQARDQIAYEFYCDTTGDIVFKPPFYNLNVLPNKPVSWIQDFEIMDDNINDSEAEVVTHMTSSGNAFGGVFDPCITDEITVPRTGVIDWHLLKRYGWRRQDFQCEWAGNPKKLFWFLLDLMDRINAKRHNGTITIPMRPEIRMGFPVWIPYYDSFFYVNSVSHNFSPGGQATTTLGLIAKRSKFIAPANMGRVQRVQPKPQSDNANNAKKGDKKGDKNPPAPAAHHTYEVSFDGSVGQTSGIGQEDDHNASPHLIIRDPDTGKILGYPNVVMVFRTTFEDKSLAKTTADKGSGSRKSKQKGAAPKPAQYTYDKVVRETFQQMRDDRRAAVVSRIRHHRYEAGMNNSGLYDYAVDVSGDFKEMVLVPASSIVWGAGTQDPTKFSGGASTSVPSNGGLLGDSSAEDFQLKRNKEIETKILELQQKIAGQKNRSGGLSAQKNNKGKELNKARLDLNKTIAKNHKGKSFGTLMEQEYNFEERQKLNLVNTLQGEFDALNEQILDLGDKIAELAAAKSDFRLTKNLNISIRPVSDEFGFEVIGHNRYGRGVFIDRGQLRLKFKSTEDSSVNDINIQFAATGGMVTNQPSGLKSTSVAASSEMFEKMQPDDWITGASMHTPGAVTLTSVNTYSAAVNNMTNRGAKTGAVFIEADATRRSKTLWELVPKSENGLDEVGMQNCSCNIGRTQWFSVLPKEVLRSILTPSTIKTYAKDRSPLLLARFVFVDAFTGEDTDKESSKKTRLSMNGVHDGVVTEEVYNHMMAVYERKDDRGVVVETHRKPVKNKSEAKACVESAADLYPVGSPEHSAYMENSGPPAAITGQQPTEDHAVGIASFPDFFEILNKYLAQRFSNAFAYNAEREEQDAGEYLGIEIPEVGDNSYLDPSQVLGPSGGSLFDRAAQGDPDALAVIQSQINWDWTESEKKLDNLKNTAVEAGQQFAAESSSLADWAESWSRYDAVGALSGVQSKQGSRAVQQPQPFTPPPLKIKPTALPDVFEDAGPTNKSVQDDLQQVAPEPPKQY
jgi:hypothetical protein